MSYSQHIPKYEVFLMSVGPMRAFNNIKLNEAIYTNNDTIMFSPDELLYTLKMLSNDMNKMLRRCHYCKVKKFGLKRCSRCKSVYYCDKICQISAWERFHYRFCRKL